MEEHALLIPVVTGDPAGFYAITQNLVSGYISIERW